MELVCHKLSEQNAQELKAENNCLLRRAKPPKPNIIKEEHKALKELRQDKESLVLTADQGVAMVVIDRKVYVEKWKAYWLNWLTGLVQQTPPTSSRPG